METLLTSKIERVVLIENFIIFDTFATFRMPTFTTSIKLYYHKCFLTKLTKTGFEVVTHADNGAFDLDEVDLRLDLMD